MRALRRVRRDKGISTTKLAEQVGCTGRMIRALEQGARNGSADLWENIAEKLGVSFEEIRKEEPDPAGRPA